MFSVNLDGLRDLTLDMTPKTADPQVGATIDTSQVVKKRAIGDLITHISRSDNHLWQALTSLQSQTNALVNQNQMPTWTSWLPQIVDAAENVLITDELLGYYMVSGQLLFIEIHARRLVLQGAPQITVSMPVDVGDVIPKTCFAWLYQGSLATQGNGIIQVEITNRTALLIANPNFVYTTCIFGMGGAIGIL